MVAHSKEQPKRDNPREKQFVKRIKRQPFSRNKLVLFSETGQPYHVGFACHSYLEGAHITPLNLDGCADNLNHYKSTKVFRNNIINDLKDLPKEYLNFCANGVMLEKGFHGDYDALQFTFWLKGMINYRKTKELFPEFDINPNEMMLPIATAGDIDYFKNKINYTWARFNVACSKFIQAHNALFLANAYCLDVDVVFKDIDNKLVMSDANTEFAKFNTKSFDLDILKDYKARKEVFKQPPIPEKLPEIPVNQEVISDSSEDEELKPVVKKQVVKKPTDGLITKFCELHKRELGEDTSKFKKKNPFTKYHPIFERTWKSSQEFSSFPYPKIRVGRILKSLIR